MDDDVGDDRKLVEDALARTPGAFARLVEANQKLVWHMIHRMVQHPEDTRELSQETFIRVHQRLQQFRFESALSTWIGRIAFSVAARHLQRKRIPLVDLSLEDDAGESGLEQVAMAFDLEKACADENLFNEVQASLESLPPVYRTIVTLYHLDELSVAEIAQVTDLPAGTVKSHLYRARRALRESLEKRLGEFSGIEPAVFSSGSGESA